MYQRQVNGLWVEEKETTSIGVCTSQEVALTKAKARAKAKAKEVVD